MLVNEKVLAEITFGLCNWFTTINLVIILSPHLVWQ